MPRLSNRSRALWLKSSKPMPRFSSRKPMLRRQAPRHRRAGPLCLVRSAIVAVVRLWLVLPSANGVKVK